MMSRKPFFAVALLVALVACGWIQPRLNRSRESLGLTRTAVISNAPPVIAFTTVALGGFRGLIANGLWIRTTELQEDGKYFEAVQLADWITKLQPHFTAVWVNQAWNMAYNISVKFPDPYDRWHWVQRGIELIRDEGMLYNPGEVLMYRELGWLYQHKMGQNLDDAHRVYKTEWARMMDEVIPGGRADYASLLTPASPEAKGRVTKLRTVYKLDPAWMKHLDETYGPFDWRLPEPHAIYWSTLGVEMTPKQADKMQLRRELYQPMLATLHHGRIITNRFAQMIEPGPNLNIVTNASKAYEDSIAAEPENAEHIGRAHRNFMKDAVYFLYANNRRAEALRWYNYIKAKYGTGDQTGIPANMTVDEFAISKVTEDVNETSRDRVTAILQGFISTAFYNYAIDEDEVAAGHEMLASKIHENYQARTRYPGTDKRISLPPLSEIKRNVLIDMLTPRKEVDPNFQKALRTKLRIPANFGASETNAPPATK
jgi:hypothetical protein